MWATASLAAAGVSTATDATDLMAGLGATGAVTLVGKLKKLRVFASRPVSALSLAGSVFAFFSAARARASTAAILAWSSVPPVSRLSTHALTSRILSGSLRRLRNKSAASGIIHFDG